MSAKVVIVSAHSPFDGRVFHKEAKSLANLGYEVSVVGWVFNGDGMDDTVDGIRLVFLPFTMNKEQSVFRKARFFRKKVLPEVVKAVIARKPDIIHCYDLSTLPVGIRASRKIKFKLIYDSPEDRPRLEYYQYKLWGIFTYLLERRYLKKVDGVITVSNHIADKFRKRKIPTEVIYNTPLYDVIGELLAKDMGDIREELGLPRDKTLVGYVGSMNFRKKFDNYVKALKHLNKKVSLVLVGGDEATMKNYRKLAEELGVGKSLFTSTRVDYDKCLKYMYALDIGLQALMSDAMAEHTLPTKIFDYMALKKPYITPPLLDMAAFTRKWKCGFVLDNREPKEIARTITEAISDPKRLKTMGERGNRNIRKEFSWEKMEARLGKFYGKILG